MLVKKQMNRSLSITIYFATYFLTYLRNFFLIIRTGFLRTRPSDHLSNNSTKVEIIGNGMYNRFAILVEHVCIDLTGCVVIAYTINKREN